jgi:2-methylcitrate dehydratase PrpD
LLKLMHEQRLAASDVAGVTARVHQGALDVLGPVTDPQTVHQSKFSMGTVLAMVALHGRAGLAEFDAHFSDAATRAFRDRVQMVLDAEVDAAYPARWIGKVEVTSRDGRRFSARVDEPKGDPGNTLTRAELLDKAVALAGYGAAAGADEVRAIAERVWAIADAPVVTRLLR